MKRIIKAFTLVLTIGLSLVGSDGFAAGNWLPIDWMNRPGQKDSLRLFRNGRLVNVDLVDLARHLGIEWQLDNTGNRLAIDMAMHRLIFTAGTPFVLVDDGKIRQMPLPVTPPGRKIMAPLEPVLALLADYYPGEMMYDPSEPRLLVARSIHTIYGIRYKVDPGITRAIIPAAKNHECLSDTLDGGGVTLLFKGASMDTSGFSTTPARGLIADAIIVQTPEGTRISFIPEEGARYSQTLIETDPPVYSVVFSFATVTGLDQEGLDRLENDKRQWALDLVVIDPGHGGRDPGAIGKSGLKEKTVALDVGLRLRKALEKKGVRTVMTRETDEFVELHRRTGIANRAGGKLFVSLHCNANRDRRARGSETYFLAPAKSARAMRVAMRENEVIQYEESKDQYRDLTEENFILLSMAQANFATESQDLAGVLQEVVPAGVGTKNRGVDQAGFYVLVGASMPAVLFELAFISNPKEEKNLKDKKFRQKLADQICEAILKFLSESKQSG